MGGKGYSFWIWLSGIYLQFLVYLQWEPPPFRRMFHLVVAMKFGRCKLTVHLLLEVGKHPWLSTGNRCRNSRIFQPVTSIWIHFACERLLLEGPSPLHPKAFYKKKTIDPSHFDFLRALITQTPPQSPTPPTNQPRPHLWSPSQGVPKSSSIGRIIKAKTVVMTFGFTSDKRCLTKTQVARFGEPFSRGEHPQF